MNNQTRFASFLIRLVARVGLTSPDETWFDAAEFERLHKLTGNPIIIADHQCCFFDQHMRTTGGWFQYATAEEAAASYDRFLHDAFARPYIIGYFRCQYLTTYKERLKRFKQGLLRPDGTPFEDYLRAAQATNRRIIDTSVNDNDARHLAMKRASVE